MNIQQLLTKPLPEIPQEIRAAIDTAQITLTPFEQKNDVLLQRELQNDVGYRRFDNRSWLVAMTCPMPGITAEMIDWWFWWHVQDPIRYQVWFPGSHATNSYHKKDTAYFSQPTQPPFQDNIQYPRETIGGKTATLEIDFVTPEEFGFSREAMQQAGVATIVCGHVGIKNLFFHTEMAHIFFQEKDGLRMISRFWMGTPLNRLMRRIVMTDTQVRGMAEHCAIEYRNLAQILPELYKEYK